MQTLPVPQKNVKAFYAVLFEAHGVLSKVGGELVFFGDDATITTVEPDMCNYLAVLGEVGLADTQALMDGLHGGAAWIATHPQQEVA